MVSAGSDTQNVCAYLERLQRYHRPWKLTAGGLVERVGIWVLGVWGPFWQNLV